MLKCNLAFALLCLGATACAGGAENTEKPGKTPAVAAPVAPDPGPTAAQSDPPGTSTTAPVTDPNTAPGQNPNTDPVQNPNAPAKNPNTVQNPNTQDPNLSCPGDATDPQAAARQACVQQINAYRATLSLPPYKRWCGQAACIDAQASTDAQNNTAHSAFGKCQESAQDECPQWPDPVGPSILQCLKQMWAEGPGTDFATHGHYINMSSTMYTQAECGFAQNGNGFWGAQNFK